MAAHKMGNHHALRVTPAVGEITRIINDGTIICVYPCLSASNKNFFFGCGSAALGSLVLISKFLKEKEFL